MHVEDCISGSWLCKKEQNMKNNRRMWGQWGSVICCLGVIVFSGCVEYHKVVKSEIPQGKEREKNKEIVERNVKSTRVYEGYTTKAFFDALYASEEVRTYYTDLFIERRGKSPEIRNALTQKELDEHKDVFAWYVLAYIPNVENPSLNDENPPWTLYAKTSNGETIPM